MKGTSPFRAFWGLGRLDGTARLGLCKLQQSSPPACGSRQTHVDSHAEHPVLCPALQSGGGKGVDLSPAQPGKSGLGDESASRLSPRNLLEYRGDMVGVAGQGGGGSRWAPGQAASKLCLRCTRGSQATVILQAFSWGHSDFHLCPQLGSLHQGPLTCS